jgi:hypothetical protein
MQSAVAGQATWLRPLFAEGPGLFTTDQAEPFQCSVRVRPPSAAPAGTRRAADPTAVQSEAVMQATPVRRSAGGPARSGLALIDQAEPFQCSIRERSGDPPQELPFRCG